VDVLTGTLYVLGIGFLFANAKLGLEYLAYRRRLRKALLIWTAPKPRQYGFMLGLGVALGLLVMVKLFVVHRQAFGETMMFAYYGYLFPMACTIRRGFYEDGIWADTTFIPYNEVGGISWRETEDQVTLIIISRLKNLARRLVVPGDKYGAARRLLREKIGDHEIHFGGTGLDLGAHDERDDV